MNRFLVLALSLLLGGLTCYANTQQDSNFKKGFDFDLPFIDNEDNDKYMDLSSNNFGFGFVGAVNAPHGMNVKMGSSYELMIDNLWKVSYYFTPTSSVTVGFGMTWRNFRMKGNTRFIKEDDHLVLGKYPKGADVKFSRLKVYSLTVPVMLDQALGNNFVLSAGPVINFNVYGSLKTRYTLDGNKVKESSKSIHQNKVSIDLMAKLRYKWIGVYAKYSPSNVLKKEYGPEFKSLSTGVMLCF